VSIDEEKHKNLPKVSNPSEGSENGIYTANSHPSTTKDSAVRGKKRHDESCLNICGVLGGFGFFTNIPHLRSLKQWIHRFALNDRVDLWIHRFAQYDGFVFQKYIRITLSRYDSSLNGA
jgi:hypothetical protein